MESYSQIFDGVKLPEDSNAKSLPDNVKKAFDEYRLTFRAKFGKVAVLERYDTVTGFLHIDTQQTGVSLKRLKQLIRMLK